MYITTVFFTLMYVLWQDMTLSQILHEKSLHEVLAAAEWKNMILLCDVQSHHCPTEHVVSTHPSIYVSLDVTNQSLVAQMFEKYAFPTQLNWLVICSRCDILLNEINVFEHTHDQQGYFTYQYQWILVTNMNVVLEEQLGTIMNLLVVDPDGNLYTAMFGKLRYLQKVKPSLQKHSLQKYNLFPNLLTGFNNITLTMTVMVWPPYITKDNTGAYHGYFVETMNIIAKRLNFTYEIIEPEDQEYGSLENGQWSGMMKDLVEKRADIACSLTFSHERSIYVSFLDTAAMVSYEVIMYHKPEAISMSVDILAKPFSWEVWVVFLAVLMTTMISFHLSQQLLMTHKDSCSRYDFGAYILRSTVYQGSVLHPLHTSSRIIYSCYALGWIILMATYTAYLVSFLSVKKEVIPFRTMSELAENDDYTLGVLGGSFFYDVLFYDNLTARNIYFPLASKIKRDMQKDPQLINSFEDYHFNRLLTDKNYALLDSGAVYNGLASESCKLSVLEEKGSRSPEGYACQNNSAYANELNYVLSKIQEGELDFHLRKFLPKPMTCETSYNNVSLENLHGMFYILFGGLGIALVILIAECVVDASVASHRNSTPIK